MPTTDQAGVIRAARHLLAKAKAGTLTQESGDSVVVLFVCESIRDGTVPDEGVRKLKKALEDHGGEPQDPTPAGGTGPQAPDDVPRQRPTQGIDAMARETDPDCFRLMHEALQEMRGVKIFLPPGAAEDEKTRTGLVAEWRKLWRG